jgi:hypothetical protein
MADIVSLQRIYCATIKMPADGRKRAASDDLSALPRRGFAPARRKS